MTPRPLSEVVMSSDRNEALGILVPRILGAIHYHGKRDHAEHLPFFGEAIRGRFHVRIGGIETDNPLRNIVVRWDGGKVFDAILGPSRDLLGPRAPTHMDDRVYLTMFRQGWWRPDFLETFDRDYSIDPVPLPPTRGRAVRLWDRTSQPGDRPAA